MIGLPETLAALENGEQVAALGATGIASTALGYHLLRKREGAFHTAIPVTLRVISVENTEGGFRSEFEITDGPMKGTRGFGAETTTPPPHHAGEFISGLANPRSGEIEARSAIGGVRWIERILLFAGVTMLTASLVSVLLAA